MSRSALASAAVVGAAPAGLAPAGAALASGDAPPGRRRMRAPTPAPTAPAFAPAPRPSSAATPAAAPAVRPAPSLAENGRAAVPLAGADGKRPVRAATSAKTLMPPPELHQQQRTGPDAGAGAAVAGGTVQGGKLDEVRAIAELRRAILQKASEVGIAPDRLEDVLQSLQAIHQHHDLAGPPRARAPAAGTEAARDRDAPPPTPPRNLRPARAAAMPAPEPVWAGATPGLARPSPSARRPDLAGHRGAPGSVSAPDLANCRTAPSAATPAVAPRPVATTAPRMAAAAAFAAAAAIEGRGIAETRTRTARSRGTSASRTRSPGNGLARAAARAERNTAAGRERAGRALEDLCTGEEVTGTVVAVRLMGIWFDVGAAKFGVMPKRLFSKDQPVFEVGDTVEGLRVDSVDLDCGGRLTLSGVGVMFAPPGADA